MQLAVLAFMAALGGVALAVGATRGRLTSALIGSAIALGFLWLAAVAAYYADWRDADGWVDCWPNCDFHQEAIGAILVGSPVVLILWLAAAAVIARRR